MAVGWSGFVVSFLRDVKLTVILMFILAGAWYVFRNPDVAADNWSPFIPPNAGDFGVYGWSGVLRVSGVIFFAYIGFNAVSTTAQEARNPQRDMPIGTLLAFAIVCAGIWYLWVKEPERERPFRTPLVPLVPILGIVSWLGMMAGLPLDTWLRLVVWLVIGLVIYYFYSRHHSVLQRAAGNERQAS